MCDATLITKNNKKQNSYCSDVLASNEKARLQAERDAKRAGAAAPKTRSAPNASQLESKASETGTEDLFTSFHDSQQQGTDAIVRKFKERMRMQRGAVAPEEDEGEDEELTE